MSTRVREPKSCSSIDERCSYFVIHSSEAVHWVLLCYYQEYTEQTRASTTVRHSFSMIRQTAQLILPPKERRSATLRVFLAKTSPEEEAKRGTLFAVFNVDYYHHRKKR